MSAHPLPTAARAMQRSLARRCLLLVAVALFVPPLARAEDCEKPASAGDIAGNLRSFGCNLGKGVKIRQPYEAAPKVVAVGMLPGLPAPPAGYNYNAVCLEGEKNPQAMQANWHDGRNGVVGGKLTFSAAQLLLCADLIANGAFRRVDGVPGSAGSPPAPTYNGKSVPDPCPDNRVMLFGGRAVCEDRHMQVSADQAERIIGLNNAIQACRTMIRNGSQCPPAVVARIKNAKIGKGLPTLDVTAY
jgi:hypothetical protein